MTLPGGTELIVILLIVLLLFGSKRLPELARSLRRSRDEFRKPSDGEDGGPEGSEGPDGSAPDGTDDRA